MDTIEYSNNDGYDDYLVETATLREHFEIDPIDRSFNKAFIKANISDVYNQRLRYKKSGGIDGVGRDSFYRDVDESIEVISRKVKNGTYKFTPYAEILISKGRDKLPRVLSVPTKRDQLTLSCLKDCLHEIFKDNVHQRRANEAIGTLRSFLRDHEGDLDSYCFIKADIRGFYDNIDREKLMNFIRRQADGHPQLLKLIYSAISTPTVPRDSRSLEHHQFITPIGVPQGLAISNILASVFLSDIDEFSRDTYVFYNRYVDDILIIVEKDTMSEAFDQFESRLNKLGLKLNPEKTETGNLSSGAFNYLGYSIASGKISVKKSTIEFFIKKLIDRFVRAKSSFERIPKSESKKRTAFLDAFVEELNEKITGAVSQKKQYGWLFYYSQINDIALLHHMDSVVSQHCDRFFPSENSMKDVKSFVKAYHKIRGKRKDKAYHDYIMNYDVEGADRSHRQEFLRRRGLDVAHKPRSDVDQLFYEYRERQLSELQKNEGKKS